MAIDVHAVLVSKQERDCARLDEFLFRRRARAMRLLAEWARGKAADPGAIDPVAIAASVATATDAALIDRVARLSGNLDRRRVERNFRRAEAEAWDQLVAELGDPTPRSLA